MVGLHLGLIFVIIIKTSMSLYGIFKLIDLNERLIKAWTGTIRNRNVVTIMFNRKSYGGLQLTVD